MDFPENAMNSRRRKRNPNKYSYNFGNAYPGLNIGHKNCSFMQKGLPVPAHMGWLWNVHHNIRGLKYRRGWQPGAIGKTIAKMMDFKVNNPKEHSQKEKGRARYKKQNDLESEEPLEPKPALKVQKKGNVYVVQVNPFKDCPELGSENPYLECDPLVLKIIKKQPSEERARTEARKMAKLKKRRDREIRKALEAASEDICKCAYMDVFCNDLSAIDRVIKACPAFLESECICRDDSSSSLSSNASWDIEYTPPVGLEAGPKKQIHVDTQYIAADTGITDQDSPKTKKDRAVLKAKKKNVSITA